MSSYRLYCPSLLVGTIELSREESHHAADVLRLRIGQRVLVFDGTGAEATGTIARADKHATRVQVDDITHRPFETARRVTLAVAMPKTHRQGYLIEKCTELGCAAIWPIAAARSVTKPSSTAAAKWQRRAIEASKQSGRSWVPVVEASQSLEQSLSRAKDFDLAAMADMSAKNEHLGSWLTKNPAAKTLIVWIGPEGGWTDDERKAATEAGVSPVELGPTILRTETAAVAVCAAARLLETAGSAPAEEA